MANEITWTRDDGYSGEYTARRGDFVPILLKVWSSPGTETLRISAETYFGAAVLAPQFVTVLV